MLQRLAEVRDLQVVQIALRLDCPYLLWRVLLLRMEARMTKAVAAVETKVEEVRLSLTVSVGLLKSSQREELLQSKLLRRRLR